MCEGNGGSKLGGQRDKKWGEKYKIDELKCAVIDMMHSSNHPISTGACSKIFGPF